MTPQEVKTAFREKGVNVMQWSKEHGFTPLAVYRVLNGRAPGMRGETYRIAVALGIRNPDSYNMGNEHV
ncbi:DNA-binding protein [Betaproteobacteria bacterium]|nr:DNA-binding protein [Betaproteobacteria bacterium]GHU44355.1 DNA-binding protein [Betaproteobacteria bacterium]